jgi:glutamine phosphoribosylpyrophosphate amidotransferase
MRRIHKARRLVIVIACGIVSFSGSFLFEDAVSKPKITKDAKKRMIGLQNSAAAGSNIAKTVLALLKELDQNYSIVGVITKKMIAKPDPKLADDLAAVLFDIERLIPLIKSEASGLEKVTAEKKKVAKPFYIGKKRGNLEYSWKVEEGKS